MILAMIPARMGSQRLKQKNLRELGGVPLITRATRNCRAAGVFDGIWVNSEHPAFGEIAAAEGVYCGLASHWETIRLSARLKLSDSEAPSVGVVGPMGSRIAESSSGTK